MNKIETLKKSLVYRMSLGSKELYHSNVWAWLIEQNHEFIKVFGFDDSYVSRIERVGREEGDRDISIDLDDANQGPVIVIENKLKSIPGIDQLKKYQEGLGDRFHKGVLTGITLPRIANSSNIVEVDGRQWSFVDYQSISDGIMAILETLGDGSLSSNRLVVEEYCRCIALMNDIVSEEATNDIKPLWNGDLDDLGLQDLINKVKASKFVRRFDSYLKENPSLDFGSSLAFGHGFHNKKNTIDFRFVSGGAQSLVIGIQIEGDQFRRFAQFRDDPKNDTFENVVFATFKGNWFDGVFDGRRNDKNRRISWPGMEGTGLKTLLTHNFAKYKVRRDYCFVYQYATLSDELFEYDPLIELIIKNLSLAKQLFDEYLALHAN